MEQPQFWYLLLLLGILLAGGAWRLFRPNISNGLAVLAWLGIIALIMVIYVLRDDLRDIPERISVEFLGYQGVENAEGMRYRRDENAQVIVTVTINETAIPMLLDTGASSLMLQKIDADRLGIAPKFEAFVYPVQTAGGVEYMARVRLPQIQIGSMVLQDIETLISRENTGISLLGMSALSQLDIEFSGQYVQLRAK